MVRDGRVDVAVTDLFVTAERIRELDFSHPYFDSGLQIMIDENRHPGALDLVRGLASTGHLKVFAIGGILILLATISLTGLDRRFDSQFHEGWLAGMAESFYHVMQVTFTGKSTHKMLVSGSAGY